MNGKILTANERKRLDIYLRTGKSTVIVRRILDQFKEDRERLRGDFETLVKADLENCKRSSCKREAST
jgi:hypothetical protein